VSVDSAAPGVKGRPGATTFPFQTIHTGVGTAQAGVLALDPKELLLMEGKAMISRKLAPLGLAIVTLLVVGCGKPGEAPTVKATGTVTHKGKPVDKASVAFLPEKGRPAAGITDASGKFTLSTFKPGDGAVPGLHKVAISEPPSAEEQTNPTYAPPDPTKARFPLKYADPKLSGFTAKVEEGGKNDFTFDMKD
jgi:hypothetical protein